MAPSVEDCTLLPASPEVERIILGSLLVNNDLLTDAAEILRPDDFSTHHHQRIFSAITELGRSQGNFDGDMLAVKLENELPHAEAYLTDLECELVPRKSIKSYCEAIREKAILRRVAHRADSILRTAMSLGATSEQCRRQSVELQVLLDVPQSSCLQADSLDDFLALEIPAREMVLSPILPAQGLTMLYSKRGVGKTYLALGIALAVARGGSFLRWKAAKARKVLFLDGELPATTLQQRITSIKAGIPESEPKLPDQGYLRIITPDRQKQPMPDLATREGQMLIERQLVGAELVVLDNLSALCRSGKENEGESWLPVQEWLLRLRQRGISVLLVHHAGKSGAQRGTSRGEDMLDTVVALQHPSDYAASEGLRCEVRYEKARGFLGEEAKPFEVRMQLEGGTCQ